MWGNRLLFVRLGVIAAIVLAFFIGRLSVPDGVLNRGDDPAPDKRTRLSALPSSDETRQADGGDAPAVGGAESRIAPGPGILSFLPNDFATGFPGFIVDWVESNPDEAIRWLTDSGARPENLKMVFAILGANDQGDARDWLEENRDMAGFEHAALGLSMALANQGKHELALEWFASVSDPMGVAEFWGAVGKEVFLKDPEMALQRLALSGFPEGVREQLILSWGRHRHDVGRRNAQNLASVFSSATAFGAEFEGDDPEQLMRQLVDGVSVEREDGTTTFQVPRMSGAELEAARQFLTSTDGSLDYNPQSWPPEDPAKLLADTGLPDELQRLMLEQLKERRAAVAKRNAQNLASVYSSAVAAGAVFQGTTKDEIAQEMIAGVTGAGQFSNTYFRVPNLSAEDVAAALQNVQVSNGQLTYDPPGE